MIKQTDESKLQGYIAALEDGDIDSFDDPDFLENLRQNCLSVLDEGVSPEAHYLLGVYHIQKGDKDCANQERLKAAYLGHCTAVMDYVSGTNDYRSVEILGIVRAMNDGGEKLASAQEDFDIYLSELSPEKEEKVNGIAKSVKESMEQYGLRFRW